MLHFWEKIWQEKREVNTLINDNELKEVRIKKSILNGVNDVIDKMMLIIIIC